MPLSITVGGKDLVFQQNGDVATSTAGGLQVNGAWRTSTAGETADNSVRYSVDGTDQTPIPAVYSFNEVNQLLMALTNEDGSLTDPEAFAGGIEIDDDHQLTYNLIDSDGNALDRALTIGVSNFRIEEETCNLVMDLANGGQLSITGDSGINSLEAAENRIAGFHANDLLQFHASTDNALADGSVMTVPARLSFIGTWDIQNGQLVFLSKVTGDLTKPDVHLGFAGQFGAVAAGFVYFADSAGTQVAFNISGKHVWKAGNTTDVLNWQTSLGYSQKTFSASAEFDFNSKRQSGRNFAIGGHLNLQQTVGGPLTLAFNLKANYQWKNNLLTFQADVSDVAGALTYDLMLEGTFKLSHGTIQFGVKFSNAASGNTFTLDLNVQGDRNNLIQALTVHLQISQSQAGTMINLTAEIRLRYAKGVGRLQRAAAA